MSDDPLPGVRKLLDAVPAPAVRPVDVAAIFAAADARPSPAARGVAPGATPTEDTPPALRRWKRAAGAAAALAAGLLVFAFLPRVTVRFGDPPPAVQPPPADDGRLARLEARLQQSDAKLARLEADANRLAELETAQKELKDLLLVTAADVNRLAESQHGSEEWRQNLVEKLTARLADVDKRLAEARKDNTALYTLITDQKTPEGVNR